MYKIFVELNGAQFFRDGVIKEFSIDTLLLDDIYYLRTNSLYLRFNIPQFLLPVFLE